MLKEKIIIVLVLLSGYVNAVFSQTQNDDDVIIFSAPPRGSLELETETYQPIAEFLGKVTGRNVRYQQPMSWLHYQKAMWDDSVHIMFDGPHFVSWRMKNTRHTPLLRLPQSLEWAVIANKNDSKINKIKDLQGRPFCGHPPPNFGTLTVLSFFDGFVREPHIVVRRGWKNIYKEVAAGRACKTGVVPFTNLQEFDPDLAKVKLIHKQEGCVNQAFTASSKIDGRMQTKIKHALLSEEGQAAMLNLRNRYARGEMLVEAGESEYRQIANVLDNVYGFGFTMK